MSSSEAPRPQHRTGGRQPLLWAASAFAAGIFTAVHCWRPPVWWLVAAVTFLVCSQSFLKRRPWASISIALAALFCAGAFSIALRPPKDPGHAVLAFADGQEVSITAHVRSDGVLRAAGFGDERQVVDVETEEIAAGDRIMPLRSGLRISLYSRAGDTTGNGPGQLRIFHFGERLRFIGKLHLPRNFRNPGAFDYETYLAENGIAALGSAKAAGVQLLPGLVGSRAEFWRALLHRSIINKIHVLWPPEQAALLDAMVIGEDAFIDRETRLDFQRSGTYHILVVSGMNVGILAFVTFWLLRRFRISEVISSAVTVLLSLAYAFITDVGPPIWRATLMLALYLCARLLYRERSMLNGVGAAALGLLIVDPRALLGASFQLTFLSVLIIAGVGVPILERTTQPLRRGLRHLDSAPYDAAVSPRVAQLRLDLRLIAERLEQFLRWSISLPLIGGIMRATLAGFDILTISALMQVGLAMPMAYYFHRATVLGLPANVLVVPLTGILMPAAVLALTASYVWLPLARIPAVISTTTLHVITGTVSGVSHARIGDMRVATPEITSVLFCAGTLAIAIMLVRRRPALAAISVALIVSGAAFIVAIPPQPQIHSGVLEVTGLDVGQADSTLLISPRGRTLLIDAGGPLGGKASDFDIGEEVVSPYLWARGISRLDAVMVTHGHSDHIGGLPAVLRNFHPHKMWIGVIPPGPAFSRLLQEARQLGITVVEHGAGDRFDFGGAEARVFSPAHNASTGAQPRNNDSLVVSFTYGNTCVLVEGDAEKQIERLIAPQLPRTELLKLAHNGSNTSTTSELLSAVPPRFALISVGARNTFGHPKPQVLQRLAAAGVAAYRTDLDGAITFYLDGQQVMPQAALH